MVWFDSTGKLGPPVCENWSLGSRLMPWYIFWAHMTQIQFLRPQTTRSWNVLRFHNFIGFILWFWRKSVSGKKVLFLKIGAGVLDSWLYTSFGDAKRRKITYHPLLIGFFHKLISIQDVRCNMLHFTCSATADIALCSCTSKLSPINDKDAALNIHLALIQTKYCQANSS